MMGQFWQAKQTHPDCLIFFRMGDFYELFFDDAIKAAEALDITLTKRGQHDGEDVPMAGVPAHAHEAYLARLIRQGFKVAICEQMETPSEAKKRSGKTLVRRDVIRVITPGTITEDTLLEARSNNFLVALADAGGALGLAVVDITTGVLTTETVEPEHLGAVLARIDPGEVLLPDRLADQAAIANATADWLSRLSVQPNSRFDSENARHRLHTLYGVASLDAFGSFGRPEIAAAGALIDYIDLTQKGRFPRLSPPRHRSAGSSLEIDAATRRNLELMRTLSGDRKGSLLSVIDRTLTGAGARLLNTHLTSPLTDRAAIDRRLDATQYLIGDARLHEDLRAALRRSPDIERALSRLSLGRGGPRDLAAIRDGLAAAQSLRQRIAEQDQQGLPDLLAAASRDLKGEDSLVTKLADALVDEPPALIRDGGFVAGGYDATLDDLRTLRDDSRKLIAGLQTKYADATGVSGLKIKHNNVIGYHIEVTPTHAGKLTTPEQAETFIHRQTLGSAVRFTTVELTELERAIGEAADKALATEMAVFEALVADVIAAAEPVATAAAALAALDVVASHARLASDSGWVRPTLTDDTTFDVKGGRHPVVEAALMAQDQTRFVANDCDLGGSQRLWLLTGPNMAGKSTFLRQNALIAILAQMGAYVPADSARIGIVDRLFSRVGASDDLARGRSTFMVEMVETAAILNQATPQSLVILDEIGRGTATFDGLSIAWAAVEHLHETIGCRALFATHYHELTALGAKLANLSCHTMRVKEWQGDIVFLHEVGPGAADRSYGIHVAKLAGLPPAVVGRAEQVLNALEQGEQGSKLTGLADDLPLFAVPPPSAPPPTAQPTEVDTLLESLNPDEMTPRAALEYLYALKRALQEES